MATLPPKKCQLNSGRERLKEDDFNDWGLACKTQNLTPFHLFCRQESFNLYLGWPLSAPSFVIYNIASETLS